MALIPDVSGGVKRLQVYERELARRMAFDDKFGDSKRRRDTVRRSMAAAAVVAADDTVVVIN